MVFGIIRGVATSLRPTIVCLSDSSPFYHGLALFFNKKTYGNKCSEERYAPNCYNGRTDLVFYRVCSTLVLTDDLRTNDMLKKSILLG